MMFYDLSGLHDCPGEGDDFALDTISPWSPTHILLLYRCHLQVIGGRD